MRALSSRIAVAVALVALPVLAACGSSSAQVTGTTRAIGTPAASRCSPDRAGVIASDRRAQVYSLQGNVYGCDRKTRKRTRLGQSSACIGSSRVSAVALAADVVAYGLQMCGVDASSASVLVVRLADGKRLRSYPAVTGQVLPESFELVGSVVVKPGGAVAWIASVSSIVSHASRVGVYRNGSLIDPGPGVQPKSLRLSASTLSWRHGAATRTATLN